MFEDVLDGLRSQGWPFLSGDLKLELLAEAGRLVARLWTVTGLGLSLLQRKALPKRNKVHAVKPRDLTGVLGASKLAPSS